MQRLGQTGLEVSRIGLGCMRMASLTEQETAKVLDTVVGQGINFFDHADIYGGGESEIRFAQGAKLAGLKREDMILQSKCGIRKGYFDFSKDYILESVDEILKRLDTDYLDVLALTPSGCSNGSRGSGRSLLSLEKSREGSSFWRQQPKHLPNGVTSILSRSTACS